MVTAGSHQLAVWLLVFVAVLSFQGCVRAELQFDESDFKEVASPAGLSSGEPNLMVGNGSVYLSWIETGAGQPATVKFSKLSAGKWDPARAIVTDADLFVNWADFPGLLQLKDGTLVAAWFRKSGKDPYAYDIQISTSKDEGLTWSRAVSPHRDGTQTEHGFVSLVTDPSEGFWAIWVDGRNYAGHSHEADSELSATESPETQLRAAHWKQGQFLEEVVLDGRVCDCCQTAGARSAQGLVVAYRDRDADEVRDISLIQYTRATWGKSVSIRKDAWKIDGCPVNGPAMATQGERLALAWFTDAADQPKVFVAVGKSSALGRSQVVQVDDGNPLGRVDVEWLHDGSVLVSWIEQAGAEAEIRIRRISLAGEKSSSRTIAPTSLSRVSGFPRLAVVGSTMWMAWTDTSSEPARVRVGKIDLARE